MKKILKSVINFYNSWYGVINSIIGLFILSKLSSTLPVVICIILIAIDIYTWYKNVFKNRQTKRELFGSIGQNNSLCIYGGIGTGKTTLADYIINKLIPPEKRYYNTNRKGFKAFTNEHLLLHHKLEDGCGVLIDEAGGQADAYHYEKKDNQTRKRIDFLNKFFRQWYTDKALLIYVDQCQSNMNTSLYKNIYYVIQCKGLDKKPSALVPHLLCKIGLFFINLKRPLGHKINNPFTNVSIEYMEFSKMGDYADHYNVIIQDKDHKKLVGSIYEFFSGFNTYVFREYNPSVQVPVSYIWGTNKQKDDEIMNDNFNLDSVKDRIKNSFSE